MRELLLLLFLFSPSFAGVPPLYGTDEETVDSGYENAEKYQKPQPPVSAKGGNQLGYVDESQDPYDQIFSYWEKVVKNGNYVKDDQNERFAKMLPTIKKEFSQEMDDAPPGVQADFSGTLTSILSIFTSVTKFAPTFIDLFKQLASLWKGWQTSYTKSGVMKDSSAPQPEWQKELEAYNAAQDQVNRSPIEKVEEQGFNEDGSPEPPQELAAFSAAQDTEVHPPGDDLSQDFNDDGQPPQILENTGGANIINMLANQVGRARRL